MAFNIAEFSANVGQRGLAKNNLFLMTITLPSSGALANEIPVRDLQFLCRSVDIPEFNVNTIKIKERGFGPGSSRPVDLDYNPLSSIFMIDSNFAVKRFFHRWMQEVVNYNIEQGVASSRTNGTRAYEFGYKDDYAGTIEVLAFGDHGDQNLYRYRFGNAYPIALGNIGMAWENQAEIMTMTVTFAYDEFTPSGAIAGVATGVENFGNGFFGQLTALNRFGPSLSGVQLPTSVQDAVNLYTSVNRVIGSFA